jgi:ribonuclease VapC
MFIDASAMVAILTFETDKVELQEKMRNVETILTSSLTIYEATLAVARVLNLKLDQAEKMVDVFLFGTEASVVAIDFEIGREAILAFTRFGKGRHRAALNMGDCFSYACAKVHHVSLLCKGDDFIHTDAQRA